MAPIASLTFAQANVLEAQRQLDAAILAGDKVEAARLLPILRTLVAVECEDRWTSRAVRS